LADLAVIAAMDGEATVAARLAGAAAAAFGAVAQIPDPDDAADQSRLCDQLASEMGAETFASIYEEGRSLAPGDVLTDPAYTE
jgi:hypothetical protein